MLPNGNPVQSKDREKLHRNTSTLLHNSRPREKIQKDREETKCKHGQNLELRDIAVCLGQLINRRHREECGYLQNDTARETGSPQSISIPPMWERECRG